MATWLAPLQDLSLYFQQDRGPSSLLHLLTCSHHFGIRDALLSPRHSSLQPNPQGASPPGLGPASNH